MKNIINISNTLSFIRFLLVLPLYYFLNENLLYPVIIVVLLAYITDILDGFFARRLNQITEIGKIIDPLADKSFIAIFIILLMIKGIIPFWFFVIVILRDILILIGGLYISSKQKKVPASNKYGKVAVFFIGVTLLLSFLNVFPDYILQILYIIATIGIVISFLSYLNNFYILIKK